MIDPKSTSYPILATSQAFDLTPEEDRRLYVLAHAFSQCAFAWYVDHDPSEFYEKQSLYRRAQDRFHNQWFSENPDTYDRSLKIVSLMCENVARAVKWCVDNRKTLT